MGFPHGVGIGNGTLDGLVQQLDEFLDAGGQLGVFGVDPAQANGRLVGQGDGDHVRRGEPLYQKAAAGAERVRVGHDIDGGEIVVDDDALGWLFQGEHLEFLGKVHRHALGLLKADVGVAFQVRLRHLVQLGEGMALADKDAGGHGGQFVEGQVPGVQQMADDLLRHLGEENDAHICPVLVDIGNDLFHAGVLDGVLVMVVRNVIQHFQERVVGKGIALGGDAEMHRCGGVPGFTVKLLDPPLLLQHGDGVAEKFPPIRCELNAPVAADEKLDAQLLLQLPHGGGNAGLGEKQLVGSFVDGAAFGDLHYVGQLLKSHQIISCWEKGEKRLSKLLYVVPKKKSNKVGNPTVGFCQEKEAPIRELPFPFATSHKLAPSGAGTALFADGEIVIYAVLYIQLTCRVLVVPADALLRPGGPAEGAQGIAHGTCRIPQDIERGSSCRGPSPRCPETPAGA